MSEEIVTVRVIGAQYSVGGDRHEEGDEFELRREVAERHPLTLDIVGDGDEEDDIVEDGANEVFDANEWLDADYEERAERVRSGEVDEHLSEIMSVETSNTVVEAVGDRREELGD